MMKQYANEEMVKNAVGDEFDELSQPPNTEAPHDHILWPLVEKALRDVFDPEIPVNVFELGLIYKVDIRPVENQSGQYDIYVEMTLTSPACPVAQEMPEMVRASIFPIEAVRDVEVDIVWDPTWDPSMMAETAKLQLNMFV